MFFFIQFQHIEARGLMIGLYKRKAKRKKCKIYYMRFKYCGKQVHRSTGTTKLREAIDVMRQTKKDIDITLDGDSENLKKIIFFRDAIAETYEERWKGSADGDGMLKRSNDILHIIGNVPVEKIDTQMVRGLRRTLERRKVRNRKSGKCLSPSTVNRYMAHLKTVLNDCRKLGHIDRLPEIKINSEKNRRRTRLISSTEWRDLKEYLCIPVQRKDDTKKRLGLVLQFEILIETAMRVGESLKMEYGTNIHLDRRIIVLTADITKGKATRSIPMTDRVFEILKQRYNDGFKNRPFPWTNYYVNAVWRKAKRAIGITKEDIDFVPHALRHTTATRLLEAGIPVAKVQKLLGHKSLSTTDIYNQLIAEDLREDLQNFKNINRLSD